MAPRKNNYISADLDFAEEQLATWKAYVLAHPLHELTDRLAYKTIKGGGQLPIVVSSVEQQLKAITELMAKYLQLLEVIDKLRETEEKKKLSVRGAKDLSPFEEGEF